MFLLDFKLFFLRLLYSRSAELNGDRNLNVGIL